MHDDHLVQSHVFTFVVALHAEAKPLIRRYRLKRLMTSTNLPIYEADGYRLVISGIGKLAAAAATGYCHGLQHCPPSTAWLNIGVAGHADYPIGTALVAHRITDTSSGQCFYPSLVNKPPVITESLFTVDRPDQDYQQPGAVDMEGSGFYAAANRCTTSELAHCFKVISDNRRTGTAHVSERSVVELIEHKLDAIETIVAQLQSLRSELMAAHRIPGDHDRLMNYWHFTTYQQKKLERLLKRWEILTNGRMPAMDEMDGLKTANAVLRHIEHQISKLPIRLED